MGRKRGFGHEGSDDNDFAPSDDSGSPVTSRLKRKRRSSARKNAGASPPLVLSESTSDEQEDVVCIPDSLEQDEDEKRIAETPTRPPKEESKDAEPDLQELLETSLDAEHSRNEDPPQKNEREIEHAKESEHMGDAVVKSTHDEQQEQPRATRKRSAARNLDTVVDSESEAEPSEDDEDAYNSEEDSPDEEDAESDFAPSPERPSRKKKGPTKAPRRPQNSKAVQRAPASTRKPASAAARKTSDKSSAILRQASGAGSGSGSGKKQLGARIPTKLSGLTTLNKGDANRPSHGMSRSTGGAVRRSGLSRNVSIPPLHSYLPR